MIYIHKDYQRSEIIKELKKQYPDYKFLEVGATTTQNISQSMQQVRVVLMIFSGLAILSSLFLIGEVMFLNVIQKKKDFAILICFGARRWHLLKIVLFESLEIVLSAQMICTGLYYQLLYCYVMSQEILLNNHLTLSFDYELLLFVYSASFLLVFISQLPPLLYVFRLNTIAALKD
ncbi:MAG: ABC transporter permease [Coprobacillus cateniformis]